jgi:hypothetical protein
MKKIPPFVFVFLVSVIVNAQIDCYPRVGDTFTPKQKGVNLRLEPRLDSKVILQSPDDGGVANKGIRLICAEDGLINDFVKVKVLFWNYTMKDYGINQNLDYLMQKMMEHYGYNDSFASFYNQMQDTIRAKNIYERIKSDEWLNEYSSSDNYDMSTFKGFFNYWVQCSESKDSINFILENHERILYVHKSLIESSFYVLTISGPDVGVDYYIDKIEEFKELEEQNSCQYSSTAIYTHLEKLVEILIEEEKYFEAIKKVNLYQPYLETEQEKYQIDNLKMQASYYDDNINGTLDLGLKLIEAYKQKKIVNSKENYFGDIDMSIVYGMTISCLLKLDRYQEGIVLSKECLQIKSLQYSQYIEFHAALLGSLGKNEEACKFLNDEYMKGNDSARKMYLENCK